MLQQFYSKEDILKVMKNVSLLQDQKTALYKNKKQLSLENGEWKADKEDRRINRYKIRAKMF